MTAKIKLGDVQQWDYQADIFQGRYRFVEDLGKGLWMVEHMEPTDEEIDAIMDDSVTRYGIGGEAEVLRRIDQAGERMRLRIVSRDEYAKHF